MDKYTFKHGAMLMLALVVGFGLMAGCSKKESNSSNEGINSDSMTTRVSNQRMEKTTFKADLKGESETPAVTTDASGEVTVTLNDSTIHVKGKFSGLSSAYTASHIHKGAKGKAGDVVQPLDPSINDDNMSGSFDADYTLSDSLVKALKNGMLYVNVHSKKHKGGEIRGQLTRSNNDASGSMDEDY